MNCFYFEANTSLSYVLFFYAYFVPYCSSIR